jgi:GNAT superfamily N-acetyltransferase
MCCNCGMEYMLPENILDKIEVYALPERGSQERSTPSRLDMLCDSCGRCCTCLEGEGLSRCRGCGFHFHKKHVSGKGGDKCGKCNFSGKELVMDHLLGPEVPWMECVKRPPEPDLARRVREEIRAHILPKPRNKAPPGITRITLGDEVMAPLHLSPYPEEYMRTGFLFICKRCLGYFASPLVYQRHQMKCSSPFPPGKLVYYDSDDLAIFEVSGAERKAYCQNLCLLSKMFLEHKTLYYDVECFLFYVLGKSSSPEEFSICGYFSKETSVWTNNLSCLMVLPSYQGLGLGSLLIDYSYHLNRLKKPPYISGPEQPLSVQGEKSYMAYWTDALVSAVLSHCRSFSGSEEEMELVSNLTGVSVQALKDAHNEVKKTFNKIPAFADFVSGREKIKKVRRLKKEGVLCFGE